MIRLIFCLFVFTAVSSPSHADEADPNRLDWLTGCWQGEDGVTREIWSPSQGG